MTTRGQNLRSSVTGNLPPAGARLPGEIWVNFPDLQLGLIDAAKNPQKLVAVRFFSVTANYVAGDMAVQGGSIWIANGAITAGAFNSTQWTKVATGTDTSAFLPLAGGALTGPLTLAADPTLPLGAATKQSTVMKAGDTMTGPLVLPGDPTLALQASTKQYVDAHSGGGNMGIGGRITPVNGNPAITTGVTSGNSMFWNPYLGNSMQLWNGTQFNAVAIPGALTNVLANSAVGNAGPAACVLNTLYDLFIWSNAGVPTLTRGPAWANSTAGTSARSSFLTLVNGIWVNTSAITNGPAAGYGTYVGTFLTDGTGAFVTFKRGGFAAGGLQGALSVWNMYNRIMFGTTSGDTTSNWSYNVAAWRPANNSFGTLFTYVCGIVEDVIDATYSCHMIASSSSTPGIGIGFCSSTGVAGNVAGYGGTVGGIPPSVRNVLLPVLGNNYVVALEISTAVGTPVNFYGSLGFGANMSLSGTARM